jgi:hypothetical protein
MFERLSVLLLCHRRTHILIAFSRLGPPAFAFSPSSSVSLRQIRFHRDCACFASACISPAAVYCCYFFSPLLSQPFQILRPITVSAFSHILSGHYWLYGIHTLFNREGSSLDYFLPSMILIIIFAIFFRCQRQLSAISASFRVSMLLMPRFHCVARHFLATAASFRDSQAFSAALSFPQMPPAFAFSAIVCFSSSMPIFFRLFCLAFTSSLRFRRFQPRHAIFVAVTARFAFRWFRRSSDCRFHVVAFRLSFSPSGCFSFHFRLHSSAFSIRLLTALLMISPGCRRWRFSVQIFFSRHSVIFLHFG